MGSCPPHLRCLLRHSKHALGTCFPNMGFKGWLFDMVICIVDSNALFVSVGNKGMN